MPTVQLDMVQGTELEQTRDGTRYVRTGVVKDIDIGDTPDPDALVKVLQLLPQFDTALGPQSTNMKLSRIRVRPEPAKFRRVNVDLLYETKQANFTPTAYMLRDRTFSIQKRDHFIPGLRVPMVLGFEEASAGSPTTAERKLLLPKKSVYLDMHLSARAVQLTVLMYGRPSAGGQSYANHVNNNSWPTGDFQFNQNQTSSPSPFGGITPMPVAPALPKAHWRLNAYSSEFNRQAGMTLVQTEAVTKIIEDWSHYAKAYNRRDDTYPFDSLEESERLGIIADMTNADYVHGPIYPIGATRHRGVGRWGPYPLANFTSIFGF